MDRKQFTAVVTNSSNTQVSWLVNGKAQGDPTYGTISDTGLYLAPATVPSPATFDVTAVSQANPSKSGRAAVTIQQAPILVSISPTSVMLFPSTARKTVTQQFTATVSNTTNTSVLWQVNGVAGGNATYGEISNTGLYSAPASVPNPASFNVTAVSQADASKFASAALTLQAPTPSGTYNVTITATSGGASHQTTAVLIVQ
jgi:hypothetical protein